MTITFYTDSGSGSCRRVSTVIQHLNIQVETIFIDILAGENRQPSFLSINPTGMLPVIVIEDNTQNKTVLSEAAAIMIYLCEHYDNKELLPESCRMEVLQWMFWAAEHFRQPAPIYFEEKVIAPIMGAAENTSRLEQANQLLERHASILNAHLKDKRYVVGDQVTLADFDLAAALSQMPRSGIPFDQYEHIMAWADHLEKTVPAWHQSGELLHQRMDTALGQKQAN